ncbi:MAG: methylenetetrahydrofolate--tRNA-(uracil(54)-C(5))-methyltransferase (FADH(2)-oxidizing) TrmFO, partial [Deltaproteobacteria bacterium]|nr:methylenetetrahydrofolate--tRNA-(uracil(54)-C(5))-methyltransferase (FADH(2)-oxidizing) TrmFO [Deltaproteobacteria bacterium]
MKSQSKADARVIGGGLAGVEAAYHLAQLGMNVDLYEMRPTKMTPAHKTQFFAELVCSNSLKGTDPSTAHGLLKKEMRALDSIVLKVADATKVPAGRALAVDRVKFAETLTEIISSHENIRIIREETRELRKNIPTIVATGPLSSDAIISGLKELTSSEGLFFYDAISPIVDGDSIDKEKTFFSSRWSRDDTSYLNCPMDKDQYISFVEELLKADRLSPHPFESK